MKKQIQKKAISLANICLSNGEKFHEYTDDDLMNATLIFSHFLMDKIFDKNKYASRSSHIEIASSAGRDLRNIIIKYAGKDMHEIAENRGVYEPTTN